MSSLYGGNPATGQALQGNMTMGNKIPKGYELGKIQQFTPEQMKLFQSMFGQLSPESYLGRLAAGDEGIFQDIEAPALRQLGQAQGALASRFSGAAPGEISGRRGSGFMNAQSGMTGSFLEGLQAQRQGLQRQATQDLWGMSNQLLNQRPQEKFLAKKGGNFLETFLEKFLGELGGVGSEVGGQYLSKLLGLI
jgi:hypothetical protein